jgi:hypothetical protein
MWKLSTTFVNLTMSLTHSVVGAIFSRRGWSDAVAAVPLRPFKPNGARIFQRVER